MNWETLEAIDRLARQDHTGEAEFYELFGSAHHEATMDAAGSSYAELRRLHRLRAITLVLLEGLHDGTMAVWMPEGWDPETAPSPPPFEQLAFRAVPMDDWPRG